MTSRHDAVTARDAYELALRNFANAGSVLAGHSQDGTTPTAAEMQRVHDTREALNGARRTYLGTLAALTSMNGRRLRA